MQINYTDKFNNLTVIKEVKHNGRNQYLVRCDCGAEIIRRKDHVHDGRVKMCKSCASKETAKNHPMPIRRTGYEGLSGTHFLSIKNGAEKRSLEFDLDPEWLWNLYITQQQTCALTGVPIKLVCAISGSNVDWTVVTASLDRINNTKGYIKDNVWWVHKAANRLKNNYSMEELLYWCKLIVNRYGNLEPSSSNGDTVDEKVQRLTGEEPTNNPDTSAQPLIKGEDIV